MFENIEKFYEKYPDELYGKLRPVKSFPKNAGTVVEKFADYYKDKHKQTSTLEELRETVFAENSQDSDVERTYPRLMQALNFMEINQDNNTYEFTDSFIDFVNNNKDLNNYTCELLEKISSISTINQYLNLLLCILREAYFYGEVIHFPNKPEEFQKKVNDENKREEYRTRIKNIYGYTVNKEDYSPNISYVANSATMCDDLELMVMTNKRIDEMQTSVLTIKGFNILSQIDSNLSYLFEGYSDDSNNTELPLPPAADDMNKFSRNLIVFGAPGTGKSYFLNEEKDGKTDDNNIVIKNGLLGATYKNNFERVTFHPDYTYANFVGSYRPVEADENGTKKITYQFVPGPFMRVLKKALIKDQPYLLIIEEINRANPAAAFGDVFQLLDRDSNGNSEYSISPSKEMIAYLKSKEDIDGSSLTDRDINELRIPSNMFIWATMNSADQGVYPMDTAFKRRWDFEYIGINDGENEVNIYVKIPVGNNKIQIVNWNTLRKRINDNLLKEEVNEDKLLGPFFISKNALKNAEKDPEAFAKIFKSKVIMYLFEDAARQKKIRNSVFPVSANNDSAVTLSGLFGKFDEIGVKLFGLKDNELTEKDKLQPSNDNSDNESKDGDLADGSAIDNSQEEAQQQTSAEESGVNDETLSARGDE